MSSGFLCAGMGGLAAAFTHLVVLVQNPVHGGDRSEVGPLVEQFGVDGGRGLIDELVGLEGRFDLLALDIAQGPGLRSGDPFGSLRGRAPSMVAIPGGPVRPDSCQSGGCPHEWRELADGVVDHLCSPFSAVLSMASCSNSAESFFWISTTCGLVELVPQPVDLPLQPDDLTITRIGLPSSRRLGQGSICPWSRWRRQVTINEEYKPSRRSIAPRADRGRMSYSARTLALYFAENCRRPKERSGTSGSGGAVSSIAPAWWRARSKWLIVVVMGEVPSPPFSSLICQGKPSHSRLTQRVMMGLVGMLAYEFPSHPSCVCPT